MLTRVTGNWVRRLWAGELALAEAFWWYGIAYGFLVNLLATMAAFALLTVDAPLWLVEVLYFLPVPYNVLVLAGVWRSAGHWQGAPGWPALARGAIVIWVAAATLL